MDPIILFFLFGLLAGLLKCEIKLNSSISELLTTLLLLTIGIKGGMELHESSILELAPKVLMVASLGFIIPLIAFPLLKKIGKIDNVNAASIAAHYGSVSVGTFAVCIAYLNKQEVSFEPYVPLFVIILEVPAIIVGLVMAREKSKRPRLSSMLSEIFRSRAITLLLGGLLIGSLAGAKNLESYNLLFVNLFSGILALFLIDMGNTVSQQLGEIKKFGFFIVAFGVFMPIISGSIAMSFAILMDLSIGGVIVVTVLGASASYIAVPAALKLSLPEANLSLPLGGSLGVTFPLNVTIGIPVVFQLVHYIKAVVP